MLRNPIARGLGLSTVCCAAALANGADAELPAPIAASVAAPTAPVSATDMRVFWNNGLCFETADKQYAYSLSGRIHLDGTYIDAAPGLDTAPGGPSDADRVAFRRTRLQFDGVFYESFAFRTSYDFAGGSANFRDVYVQLRKLRWGTTLWLGQYREPFGLDQLNSSNDNAFLERSLVDILSPGRSTGVALSGAAQKGKVSWSVGVFHANSTASVGTGAGDGAYAATGRLTWAPVMNDAGTDVVHMGVALSQRENVENYDRSVTRPEFDATGNWIVADFDAVDSVTLMGAEAAMLHGPLGLQGEFVQAEIDGANGDTNRSAYGYYVQATYGLTGEGRTYKGAVIQRPKPTTPYAGPGTGCGAWELAARYSFLDLGTGAIESNDAKSMTVGINWYANTALAVRLNYVLADFDSVDATANAVGLRVQVVF